MFKRFKAWLIRKLGAVPVKDWESYQEQCRIIDEFKRYQTYEFLNIIASQKISARDFQRDSDGYLKDQAVRSLKEQIYNQLLSEDCLMLSKWQYNGWDDTYVKHATAIVAKNIDKEQN